MLSLVEALTPFAASAWAYSSAMTADSVKSADPTTTAAPLLADPVAEDSPSGPPAELPPPQAASSREARLTPASAKVLLRFMLYSVSRRVSPRQVHRMVRGHVRQARQRLQRRRSCSSGGRG